MTRLVGSLGLVVALLAPAALADDLPRELAAEHRELDRKLALAEKRLLVAQKESAVAAQQLVIANDLMAAATARMTTAEAEAAAELARRRPTPEIRVNTARISVVGTPLSFCNATDFLRYTCHGKVECTFVVDATICGRPAPDPAPLLFSAQFSCGTVQNETFVPFGQNAWLTCK